MPVFKAFMKIAVKLLPLISIYIGVFLGTTIAMTNSDAPNKTTSFTDSKVKVAIIDRDNSTLSKALYDYLNENHKIVEVKDDAQSIKDDLFNISVSYVLTIPEGFEEKFVAKEGQNSLKQDFLPGDSEARLVSNELSSLLNYINVNLSSGMTIDNAIAKAKETMGITVNVELTKEEAKLSYSKTYFFFRYIPYAAISILILGLGNILVEFKKKEVAARINSSALTLKSKNIQLILACSIFSLALFAFFALSGMLFLQKEFFKFTTLLYLLNAFVFIIASVAIALAISQIAPNPNTITILTNVIGLGGAFLGGIFVDISFLDKTLVNTVSRFLPTYWSTMSVTAIENGAISEALTNIGIEALFIIPFFVVALVLSKVAQNKV